MAITRDSENLYSSMRFVGDGVTKRVPLTFDLREGDGLAVDFGEGLVTEGYLIDYETTPVVVVFSEPLPKDKTVTIRRLTKIDKVKHIFQWTGNAQGGADFSAKNVDENFEQITRASQDAMDSQALASQSLEEMAGIRDDAIDARDKAKQSETNAKESEQVAKVAQTESNKSALRAGASAQSAKDSELNAKASELGAKASETNAHDYEVSAKESASKAKVSETNSAKSETNAKSSELKSKASETNAKASETKAKDSEVNAKASESNSKDSEVLSKKWATNPVDVPVVNEEYSAYHWASKAREASTGITPEVQAALNKKWDIQPTVGDGTEVMKRGAFGLGGRAVLVTGNGVQFGENIGYRSGIYVNNSFNSGFERSTYGIYVKHRSDIHESFLSWGHSDASKIHVEILTPTGSQKASILNSLNTRTDKNNVLHAGTSTPINTLNVSDMSQEVINNDLLTVTSGAVYRGLEVKRGIDDRLFDESVSINGAEYSSLYLQADNLNDIIIQRDPKNSLYFINRNSSTGINAQTIRLPLNDSSGTIALTSDIPTIDYGRTCALGGEQRVRLSSTSTYLEGLQLVPINSVVTRVVLDMNNYYMCYRPIIRAGW